MSTSNSDIHRRRDDGLVGAPPGGPWGRAWAVGLLLVLVTFAGLEILWRSLGHRPSITPTAALWSLERERVARADGSAVVLLGGSRMQMGFDVAAFVAERPSSQVIQLAIAGTGPFAALRDLAEGSSFAGLVICSVTAQSLQPSALEQQQRYVDYFHSRWGPGKKLELYLTAPFQDRFAFLQRNLVGRPLLRSLAAGHLPPVNFVRTTFARRRLADYRGLDMEELITSRLRRNELELEADPPASAATWRLTVARLAGYARRIGGRGGRVVFVHFPTRARYTELLDRHFPRQRYWDVLAASVGAPTLHHEDLDVAGLSCPDESHLDPLGAIAFTREIARQVTAHELLAEGGARGRRAR